MAAVKQFEDLEVWQDARTFAKAAYEATHKGDFAKDSGLKSQFQRAAILIMSNIAEGFEGKGNKEFSHFLFVAKASAGEVRSILWVARDVGYLTQAEFEDLSSSALSISRQLSGFIKYLNASENQRQRSRSSENLKPDHLRIYHR